jgi:chromosome segregation ATPase
MEDRSFSLPTANQGITFHMMPEESADWEKLATIYKMACEKLEKETKEMSQTCAKMYTIFQEQTEKHNALLERYGETESTLKKAKEKCLDVEKEKQAAEEENHKLKNENSSLKEKILQLSRNIQLIQEEKEVLLLNQEILIANERTFSNAKEDLERLKQDNDRLRAENLSLREKKEQLEKENQESGRKLDLSFSQLENCQKEIEASKTIIVNLERDLSVMPSWELCELQQQITVQEKVIEQRDKMVLAAERKRDQLFSDIANVQVELQHAYLKIEEINATSAIYLKVIKDFESDVERLHEESKQKDIILASSEQKVKNQATDYEKKLQEKDKEKEELKKKYKKKLKDSREECQKYKQEVAKKNQEISKGNKELKKIKENGERPDRQVSIIKKNENQLGAPLINSLQNYIWDDFKARNENVKRITGVIARMAYERKESLIAISFLSICFYGGNR